MDEKYRAEALAEAERESAAARRRYEVAMASGTNKAKRKAAEELEFWGNKTAFLSNAR